jgi:NarL family two-component system response regulator LiaR
MESIRVLIVDDHAIVRQGLKAFLETEEGIEIVGEAANGTEAVQLAATVSPSLILMDLVMPDMHGNSAIAQIERVSPTSRILVLTSFGEDEKLFPAIQAGAAGYLLKDIPPEDLILAIRCVAHGNFLLDGRIANHVLNNLLPIHKKTDSALLTAREVEVLNLVAKGYSNKQIALKLTISVRTVKTHVSNILRKFDVTDRTQAALHALADGVISPEEAKQDPGN